MHAPAATEPGGLGQVVDGAGGGMAEIRAAVVAAVVGLAEPWLCHQVLAGERFALNGDELIDLAVGDLLALTHRDPAAGGCWSYVLGSYSCYRAVLAYRVAHAIVVQAGRTGAAQAPELHALARRISEDGKVLTGIEIHPSAVIGPRFVIDHGFGTVIGESAVVGSDCYILQGVVLGATGIAHNGAGKRHPTLGDRVEVGAFARILGPVLVGDDVVVGPHAVVTHNVPSATRVVVVSQYQLVNGAGGFFVTGVLPREAGTFDLCGYGLSRPDLTPTFVDAEHRPVLDVEVEVLAREPDRLSCRVRCRMGAPRRSAQFLRITGADGTSVTLIPPGGVEKTIRTTVLFPSSAPAPTSDRPLGQEASA